MKRTSVSIAAPKRRRLFGISGMVILLVLAISTPCRGGSLLAEKIPGGQAFGTVEGVASGSKALLKLSPKDSYKKGDRLELTYMAGVTPVDMGLFEVDSSKGELLAVHPVSMLIAPRPGMQIIASLHKPGSKNRRVGEYITDQAPPPLAVSGAGIEPGKMPECNFDISPGKAPGPDAAGSR